MYDAWNSQHFIFLQFIFFDSLVTKKNWVFATNSDFITPIFMQPDICRRSFKFQTMHCVRSNKLSLKYLRFTPSGWKNTGIRKFFFVAKTQFLCPLNEKNFVFNWKIQMENVGKKYHQNQYIVL